jgi:hypothetical protein
MKGEFSILTFFGYLLEPCMKNLANFLGEFDFSKNH